MQAPSQTSRVRETAGPHQTVRLRQTCSADQTPRVRQTCRRLNRRQSGDLQPADQHVDQVTPFRRLEPVILQCANELGTRDLPIIRADQNAGDGALDVHRLCDRIKPRQRLERFSIGESMVRERVERPHLSAGIRHLQDSGCDVAKLADIVDWVMSHVHLRDLHICVRDVAALPPYARQLVDHLRANV